MSSRSEPRERCTTVAIASANDRAISVVGVSSVRCVDRMSPSGPNNPLSICVMKLTVTSISPTGYSYPLR
ncbi:Uncharacterised protein [Mycobacteroides abscessus subsp. abscessus]|nr:Uncharacterised protein [Mycobacteroides abscessus subsp. abscessus]